MVLFFISVKNIVFLCSMKYKGGKLLFKYIFLRNINIYRIARYYYIKLIYLLLSKEFQNLKKKSAQIKLLVGETFLICFIS